MSASAACESISSKKKPSFILERAKTELCEQKRLVKKLRSKLDEKDRQLQAAIVSTKPNKALTKELHRAKIAFGKSASGRRIKKLEEELLRYKSLYRQETVDHRERRIQRILEIHPNPMMKGTPAEQSFCAEAIGEGFTLYRNGWPDYLIQHPDKGFYFVEVKSPSDALSESQVHMFAALEKNQIHVRVYLAGAPRKTRFLPWRETSSVGEPEHR